MRTFGVAVVATAVALSMMQVAAAVSSGGIGGRPAHSDPKNSRTQSIFIYKLDRGASKSDQLLLSNNTSGTQTIDLYAVDGEVTNTGAYTCKQKSEARSDLGGWIKLANSQVTLAAGQKKAVDFTLTMPSNADVGEHDACLVFENANDSGTTSAGVHIQTRQAVRVVATIPGDLHRNIEITGFGVASSSHGTQRFALNLHNEGNVSADVDTSVVMKSLFGNTVFTDGGSYPALPDQRLDLNFTSKKRLFFGGWYHVAASISYNKQAGSFGVSDNQSQLVGKSSETKTIFIMPSPYFFILLVIILLGIGIYIWQRQQRKRAIEKWHGHTVSEGDTLESLTKGTGVSWKRIAHVNHVRPPYTLHSGTKLRIPNKAKSNLKQ